jgi:hypothetical protein
VVAAADSGAAKSDTEDPAQTDTAPKLPDHQKEAKAKLMDLLSDDSLQNEVLKADGRATRGRLNEAIVQLEKFNPTKEPVYSEHLDGTWAVKCSASYAPGLLESPTRELALFLYGGGFSLGSLLTSATEGFWGSALNVKVESKKVRIESGRDVEAIAELDRSGSKNKIKYSAELMPLSSQRMSEEIMSVEFPDPLGKQELPLELRRTILVTYLDEDLMIVRDESGIPEVLGRELVSVEVEAPVAEANSTTTEAAPVQSATASSEVVGSDPLSSDAA